MNFSVLKDTLVVGVDKALTVHFGLFVAISAGLQHPHGKKEQWGDICPCSMEDQQPPYLHETEHCQQVMGGDPSPLLSPGETHLECWVQRWAPKYKKETWTHTEVSPEKGYKGH